MTIVRIARALRVLPADLLDDITRGPQGVSRPTVRRGGRWRPSACQVGLGEELAEVLADLAFLGVAVGPLVGVDAEGGVGFAVAEAVLDGDEVVAQGDQHRGVAVAQVMQRRLRRGEAGVLGGPVEDRCGRFCGSARSRCGSRTRTPPG